MNTKLQDMITKARESIQSRKDGSEWITSDYLEGFKEGIAEFIALQTGEVATDILEQIND